MHPRLIAAFALIAIGASACTSSTSGDPTTAPSPSPPTSAVATTPTTAPPTTTSPTPTVATTGPNVRPGEKPPQVPGLAKSNTSAGAIAYSVYWFRTLDWAYATTDSSLARTAFQKSCTDCTHFLRVSIDRIGDKNRHFVGGRIYFESSKVRANDKQWGSDAVNDVTVGQTALKVVSDSGRVVERISAVKKATFRVWLKRLPNSWTVVGWKTVYAQ